MPNIQVTNDASPNNARSESAILINPNNPLQVVAASKKFKNIQTYDFTLATAYSTDGGHTWHDSSNLAFPAGATVMTDPTLAWDDAGGLYLVGLIGNNPPTWDTIGIAVYKSTDGGKTWGNPNVIHTRTGDDKQWAAGDSNPASPFHGRVYAVWADGSTMRFARTKDNGATWIGTGTSSVNTTSLASDSFSPEINVAASGDIYIVWIAGSTIKMLVSNDGGDSFHSTTSPATAVVTLSSSLSAPHGWPVFPGGSFRVLTVPTACVFGQRVVVAWDDFREGVSRIYYALSNDAGTTWITGASGQPLLTGSLPSNFQHFFPQIIADPNGIIGCAFYEFRPKPTTPLIDVLMAQSFDGGTSFKFFTVTDQPWDPTIDAPWSHGDSNVTFIGDYFGIDAGNSGFFPLWTDTRTGVQELWTAIVPERRCAFVVERSTIGQDEIDARRGQPGGPIVPDAFRVIVDGFTAAQLGIANSGSTLNVPSPVAGLTVTCTGNTSDTGSYGPGLQRFTFHYNLDFGPTDTAFAFAGATSLITLNVSVGGLSASAQLELIKQPNPFILHGDPPWLSIDLRVFSIKAGDSKFGVPMGNDASAAPTFIEKVMTALTNGHGSAGGQSFAGDLPANEAANLFVYPTDGGGNKVFNFAIAKVHYIGLIGATNVRVFFRLFQAQTTSTSFDPSTTYRRALNPHGQQIALPGLRGNEYVTIPCFATPRTDSTAQAMDQQTDDDLAHGNPINVQTFTAIPGGAEVDQFFGCWLDINQPFKVNGDPNNVLPAHVPSTNVDGPFNDTANPPLPIQQAILRNPHQCLVAEIAFDPVTIPIGKDPGNWDKLAQRNLAWSDIPNPGVDGSRRALTSFDIRATPKGLQLGQTPDELMIDWGGIPDGTLASIYLPALAADEVLAMASRMYAIHDLDRADDHTLQCRARGITYIPVPAGSAVNYAGLLTVDLPPSVRKGQVFNVVVRQVTNAFGKRLKSASQIGKHREVAAAVAPLAIQWRRVLGAFQLTIPVSTKQALLPREERLLSVMLWIAEAIPIDSRWYPVFRRYLEYIAGRVRGFGGNPISIKPSPTGTIPHIHAGHPEGPGDEKDRLEFTGKVLGIIYDSFGDFDGFVLERHDGERCHFRSRETAFQNIVREAWENRILTRVLVEPDRRQRPISIILCRSSVLPKHT